MFIILASIPHSKALVHAAVGGAPSHTLAIVLGGFICAVFTHVKRTQLTDAMGTGNGHRSQHIGCMLTGNLCG